VPATRAHQFLDQRRIHDGATPGDPPQGVHELVHVRDPALEQVTDAAAARQQVHRVFHLDMRRQHQDGGLGPLLTDRLRGVQALGRVRRRHADVDHDEVGEEPPDQFQQLGGVTGPAQDLEVGALQQTREALTEQHVIVRYDHTGSAHPSLLPSAVARVVAPALDPLVCAVDGGGWDRGGWSECPAWSSR